jgi:hypothetical protein
MRLLMEVFMDEEKVEEICVEDMTIEDFHYLVTNPRVADDSILKIYAIVFVDETNIERLIKSTRSLCIFRPKVYLEFIFYLKFFKILPKEVVIY